MKDIAAQLEPITKALKPIVRRHVFIIILAVLGFLIFTVYTVNKALLLPPDEAYRSEKQASGSKTKFDEATIERIRKLQSSQDAQADLGTRNRKSPFVE